MQVSDKLIRPLTEAKYLNAGMDDHVAKPVDMSILTSVITKYIERCQGQKPETTMCLHKSGFKA